jgi:hypothetical protein
MLSSVLEIAELGPKGTYREGLNRTPIADPRAMKFMARPEEQIPHPKERARNDKQLGGVISDRHG